MQSTGDNRAPILYYIIKYNSSYAANNWSIASSNIPELIQTYTVPLKPWTSFTFQVIAMNKIGKSDPSLHSDACTTEPDIP